MDIVARLMQYRDYTGLTNSQFADRAGIPRPTLSQFLNGRNKRLSDDMATKLHAAYPNLNMMWLLFGEGNMLDDSNIEISEGKTHRENSLFNVGSFDFQDTTKHQMDIKNFQDSEANRKNDGFNFESDAIESKNENKAASEKSIISDFKPNPTKTVQYVMVFYTDNSFEVFRPTVL